MPILKRSSLLRILGLFCLVLGLLGIFSNPGLEVATSTENNNQNEAPILAQNGANPNQRTPSASNSGINPTCDVENLQVRWWQITTPGEFLPVIPTSCALEDGTTKPRPLSLDLLPDIAIRLFAFFVSLAWLLILPTVVFAGIWYTWGGFNSDVGEAPIKLLRNSFLSLLGMFLFYISVFTILSLTQAKFLETDIDCFFENSLETCTK